MADEGSSQEKTEDATPKRLRDARKKGRVAKSKDLNTIVIVIAAFTSVYVMKGYLGRHLSEIMNKAFNFASKTHIDNEDLLIITQDFLFSYIKTIAPYLAIVFFVAFFIGYVQVGPIFSAEPMKPQLKRLNIITNVKNMFKITLLVELSKNIAKIFLVFFLAYITIKSNLREFVMTAAGSPLQGAAVGLHVLSSFMIKVFVCFMFVALLDFSFQRWNYKKEMKMSKDEVKREYKQDEGDPLIKSHRRQLHQELAMSDVRASVEAADVVVTNPTKVAVAIKYDESGMMAPQVMAKGQRLFAEMIRDIATEKSIPIMQNVPLAWALLELDVGDEIPEELYAAVAEVLILIYKMRDENPSRA